MHSLAGLAWLVSLKPPAAKSASLISTARASPYALLVTWHSSQSPRPASASTNAGRNLLADKSEKGNGNNTTQRRPNYIYRYAEPTTWSFSVTTRM